MNKKNTKQNNIHKRKYAELMNAFKKWNQQQNNK